MTEDRRNFLVRLRPREDTVYVSQSRAVLATGRDGFIAGGPGHGLFVHQTRLLSHYRYLVDGRPPQAVALSTVEQHSWLGYYIVPPSSSAAGGSGGGAGQGSPEAAQQTIELRLTRAVGDGLHEDVDLTNFTQQRVACTLTLEVDADFADQEEAAGQRQQQGILTRHWQEAGAYAWELVFDYRAEHRYDHQGDTGIARLHRGLTLRIETAFSPPAYAEGRLDFHVELAPRATWHACVKALPLIDGQRLAPLYGCHALTGTHNERDRRRLYFLQEATRFSTPASQTLSHVVTGALEQATRDLVALRLYDLDHGERAWTLAAGLPIYIALFGRDVLTAAWQAALASPDLMHGTLVELARWQGTEVNDWRDEQPGRMLHEAHTGPLEVLNVNPRHRYYGSQVRPPIATCEEQGFVYVAKFLLSEVLWWLSEKDQAKRLYREAGELKKRFNQAFWMAEEGFFALGLDPNKRQIKSIGSNPGHCMATGIVETPLVGPTVGRLMADDLWTGWGLRTLSSQHPAYNPYSYHRGSVWPVEHGTFALAFARYGLPKHLHRLVQGQFEAAALFDFYRLPEVFSGQPRDAEHPFPALYPQANWPQAWSASAVFCFVQAMLGLYPYAPLNILLLDPHLPEWLPELKQRGARDALAVATDVADTAQVQRLIDRTVEHFGRIDMLMVMPGLAIYAPTEQTTLAEFERIVDVMLLGYVRAAKAVLPVFRRQGEGTLITMASALGKGAAPLQGAYTAAKHGIVGFTQTLQMELQGSGIDVCLVLPGSMATPLPSIHSRSKTGRVPTALPPVFHPKRVSRTLIRCAEYPRAVIKPDLQSKLAIPLGQLAPGVVKRVLARYGERLQLTDEPEPSIGHDNVDTSMAEGTEVLGRWPPTGERLARWVKAHRGEVVVGGLVMGLAL